MRISDWSSDVCSSDLAVLRGLIDADAGAAGGRIDDIDAAVELALGELGATRRIVPRGRRGAGHVLHHLDVAADVLGALPIAQGELADPRDVHAPHEHDLDGLRPHGCSPSPRGGATNPP